MGLFSFLFGSKVSAPRTSTVLSCAHSESYVILDTETTGLNPYSDKIIQLSAIKYGKDGSPIDFYNTYLNPGCPIPSSASKINGITDKMVAKAPSAEQIQEQFLSFIGKSLIVGYNTTFDLRFLNYTFSEAFSGRSYVDVLSVSRLMLALPDYKLETVASSVGFAPDHSFHDSFSDCEAVAAILHFFAEPDLLADFKKEFCPTVSGAPSTKYYRSQKQTRVITPHIFTVEELQSPIKHPLFMKNIVFTGELKMSRYEASQAAVDCGAILKTAVSGKTNYLVVGTQNPNIVGADGMSSKERKAYELNDAGKASIKIIGEYEFLALLHGKEVNSNE